jgi:hypothetical protein
MNREDDMSLLEKTWEAKPRTWVFQGGVSIEMELARHWALVMDVRGRTGKFKNMTGPYIEKYITYAEAPDTENDAYMWYWEHRDPVSGEIYPMLDFGKDQSFRVSPGNIRKAELNLSGIALRVGFRFTF